MSKESGDGEPTVADVLRKLKGGGGAVQGRSQVTVPRSRRRQALKCHRLNKYMPYPTALSYMPPPPGYALQRRLPPQCIQPPIPYMAPYPPAVPVRKLRHKSIVPKKKINTGTMLTNVTHALEDFQKKRDKFLNYLAQLHYDLNRINLPSASKEKIDLKSSKEYAKKKKKINKPKPKKMKEKEIDASEVTPSRFDKSSLTVKKIKPKETVFS